jgi:hypothetical protein
VQRIRDLALERGPLGVCQRDFDYPARDGGRSIPNISRLIAAMGEPRLLEVEGSDGRTWMLPEFAPDVLLQIPWKRCLYCPTTHHPDWPHHYCGRCGNSPLISLEIHRPATPEEAAA